MLLIQIEEYNNDIFTIRKIIYIILFIKFRVYTLNFNLEL